MAWNYNASVAGTYLETAPEMGQILIVSNQDHFYISVPDKNQWFAWNSAGTPTMFKLHKSGDGCGHQVHYSEVQWLPSEETPPIGQSLWVTELIAYQLLPSGDGSNEQDDIKV